MLEHTRGIFLRSVKYSETSVIAVIYTEAYGRQSYMVNGARSKKSVGKTVAFQPLYLLDLEIYYHAGREIHRLKDVRISNPYSTIPFDIRKTSEVIFLAEILYKCLKEEEPNAGLFDFIYNTLSYLDLTDHGISNFHIWFIFKLTQFLGIYPNNDHALISNYFDLQTARFISHEPMHGQFADKHVTTLFARLFDVDQTTLDQLDYNHNDRRLVLEMLLEYYRIHFDNLGEIRSLSVLKEVLK
ncbi:MAG TPA: DNA repair protein RecO [Prolixibacteraceae bacterium]|nr:DNA repair protein RecO [Prolixibacteraceae bacterium]